MEENGHVASFLLVILDLASTLEILLAVMNCFVLGAYNEWEQKFFNASWKMYATLLDLIEKAGPSLTGKFE